MSISLKITPCGLSNLGQEVSSRTFGPGLLFTSGLGVTGLLVRPTLLLLFLELAFGRHMFKFRYKNLNCDSFRESVSEGDGVGSRTYFESCIGVASPPQLPTDILPLSPELQS